MPNRLVLQKVNSTIYHHLQLQTKYLIMVILQIKTYFQPMHYQLWDYLKLMYPFQQEKMTILQMVYSSMFASKLYSLLLQNFNFMLFNLEYFVNFARNPHLHALFHLFLLYYNLDPIANFPKHHTPKLFQFPYLKL